MRANDVQGQRPDLATSAAEPAKVPGRKTRVEADRAGAGAQATPGRRTLVEGQAGGDFDGAVADATRYMAALTQALTANDPGKTREAASSLEQALAVVKQSVSGGGAEQGAERLHATISIMVDAEPLLARAKAQGGGAPAGTPQAIAAAATQGPGSQLPHFDRIQAAFGRHNIGDVRAYTGADAAAGASAMGARAFATGDRVAFAGTPDLHTAAHEAAHVIQQRSGRVQPTTQMKAIDGGSGDVHERHADAVADAVVAGGSAEALLDRGPSGDAPAVQRKATGGAPASGAVWNPTHLSQGDGAFSGDGLVPASTHYDARANLEMMQLTLQPLAKDFQLVQLVMSRLKAKHDAMANDTQPLTAADVEELEGYGNAALGAYNTAFEAAKAQTIQSLSQAQVPPGLETMQEEAAERVHEAFGKDEGTLKKALEWSEKANTALTWGRRIFTWAAKAKAAVAKTEKWEHLAHAVEGFAEIAEKGLEIHEALNASLNAVNALSKTNDSSMSNAQQGAAGVEGGVQAVSALLTVGGIFGLEVASSLGTIWSVLIIPETEQCLKALEKLDARASKGERELLKDSFFQAAQGGGMAPRLSKTDIAAGWFPGGQATLDYMWAVWQGSPPDHAPAEVTKFFYDNKSKMNAEHKSDTLDTEWHMFSANEVKNLKSWVLGHRREVWEMLYGSMPHPGSGDVEGGEGGGGEVQRKATGAAATSDPAATAAAGTRGAGGALPHLDTIQQSFGRHDVSHTRAHVGGAAAEASAALGAKAYTSGDAVGFASSPDLHTAAHEAAHVVQQRQGVQLKGLDGGASDPHERHADAVADAVVAGRSAESLLDARAGGGGSGTAVQRKEGDPKPDDGKDGKDGKDKDRGGRPPKGSGKPPQNIAAKGGTKGSVPKTGGAGAGATGAAPAGGFSGGGAGIDGKAIKAALTAFNQGVTANTNTVAPPDGVHADPKGDSEEDHDKKVSQYRDGIDGIASMIGDLDAFDDLCSACSAWGSDQGKQQQALAQIRTSKPFHQLSQMWQGALDGGQDSPAMQAAFEHEFSSRGFFGSTQQAYQLVRDAAKAQAKEDADAAAAKKKAEQAKGKGPGQGVDGKDAGKTTAGKPNAAGVNGGGAGGANAANLNAVVAQQATPIASYEQLKGVSDGDFKGVIASADHHAGLSESAPKLGAEAPRTGQIMDQLKRAGSGFKESFVDTVKWGVIAHMGDKMVGGAVEKLIGEKVPIIGPLIMLAVDPPWTGKYWKDTGKGFSDGWKSLKSAFSFDAFKKCHSTGDYVGVLCAKVADLFNTFYQWLSTINKLIGTLSAICLILGAVLIGIGIALAWLGVGAGLMAAGGWLVEAGEVLGDIGMALVPVCLALAGLSLVFRTAASFLVPADVYAEQLEQEGGAAESFGKMAGQKVGLDTSRTIEEATPNKSEAKPDASTEGGNTEQAAGAQDGAKLGDDAKAGNDAMQADAAAAQAKAQEHAGEQKPAAAPETKPAADAAPETKPEAKGDEKGEHTDEKKDAKAEPDEKTQHSDKEAKGKDHEKGDEKAEDEKAKKDKEGDEEEGEDKKKDDDKKKSAGERLKEAAKDLGRRLKESLKTSLSLGRNLSRLGSALAEVPKLFGENAHGAVDRGLSTRQEAIEHNAEKASEALEKLGEEAEAQHEKIKEATEKLTKEDADLTKEQAAELEEDIAKAKEALEENKHQAEKLEKTLKLLESYADRAKAGADQKEEPSEAEADEGSAAEDESGKKLSKEEKRRAAEDEAKAKGKELDEAKTKQLDIAKEIVETNKRLEEAKLEKAEADKKSEAAVKQLEDDPANTEAKAASDENADRAGRKKLAEELDKKAGKIESGEARRKSAEAKLKKTIGKTVELGGEPNEIVGFGPEGVTVRPKAGGAERTVKPEEITGGEDLPADFKAQVERLAKANEDIAEATEGEQGGNAGAIAKKLHDQATELKKSIEPKKGRKAQEKAERRNKLAADYDAKKAKAEEPAKQADNAVESAEQKLDKLKDEQKENDEEIDHLKEEIDDAKGEAHTIRREAQRHRRTEKAMEKGFEGAPELAIWLVGVFGGKERKEKVEGWYAAPGKKLDQAGDWLVKVTKLDAALGALSGVVSSKTKPVFSGEAGEQQEKLLADQGMGEKKEGGEKKQEGEDKKEEPTATAAPVAKEGPDAKNDEPGAKKEPDAAKPADAAKAPDAKKEPEGEEKKEEGEQVPEAEKLKKEAWKVGHAQALYEQLMALRPPPDIALLGDHRKKAAAAAVRYYDAHGRAYKAYQAELAIGKLAQDTAQLSEEGKPLHKQSKESRAPMEKSKADEAQRASTLGGAQTGDVKSSDSRMGGMVMGLISKIGDNSDHLSAKPDAGGSNGDQMSGGQDKADQEAKGRTAQGKGHSQGQQQFLDQAIATQGRQEQAIAGNIAALDAKQQQELADRDSVRQKKAAALDEEQQARSECETESAAFNDGYARAKAWSVQYEAKRKDVKAGGGDGP